MYDDVLVATDGSEPATAAARHAVELAAVTGATVHALFVVDTDTGWLTVSKADVRDSIREIGEGASREALQGVEHLAREAGVPLETAVREGSPEAEILAYAEDADVDLVVLGTHGHSALKRRLLGSVAERVINGADVPVTTVGVPAGDGGSTDDVASARATPARAASDREAGSAEHVEPADEAKSGGDAEPVGDAEPAEGAEPAENAEPAEGAEPADDAESTDDAGPPDDAESADDAEPVDETASADER